MSYFYCADYDSTTFVTQSVKHISFQFTKKNWIEYAFLCLFLSNFHRNDCSSENKGGSNRLIITLESGRRGMKSE